MSTRNLSSTGRRKIQRNISNRRAIYIAIISAYITNLGKYNEGELVGKWHDFPTTPEEIAETFREIRIDGARYEEFFISDYDVEVHGLIDHLGAYTGLDEINYLASLLDEMEEHDLATYEAIAGTGEYCYSLRDLINLTGNTDCFDYLQGVNDDYDLGYYWVEESGCYDTESMGALARYIDYERFGRDISLDEDGTFASGGYVLKRDSLDEFYDGMDMPEEYRVFPAMDMYTGPAMAMGVAPC